MEKIRNRVGPVLFVFIMLTVLSTPEAKAVAILELSSGEPSTLVTITDGGSGDFNPGNGVVTYIGVVGQWDINVSTGITKPALGSPQIHVDSVNLTFGTPSAPLTIRFTDTGFTGVYPGFESNLAVLTAGTVTLNSYYDANNNPFGTTTLVASLGPLGPGPGAFTGYDWTEITPSLYPFSLTEVVTITHPSAGVTSFNSSIAPVPEPGTLILFGTGLVGLAGWGRKKFRK